MSQYIPAYTNSEQVRIYLKNKAFSGNKNQNPLDGITPEELIKYTVDAENQVENELSRQYVVPFQNSNGQAFNTLPQRTQLIISNLCTWKAVKIILMVYFGGSEGTRGTTYLDYAQEQYDEIMMQAEAKDEHGQYSKIPLPGLMLNPHASYRSDAGAPRPRTVVLGVASFDDSAQSRRKLTNLNKSIWRGRGRFPF